MTDATNRKLDVDDDSGEDIARDDPLFELSQIIGYTPETGKGSSARSQHPEQMDLEDALVAELEGDASDYDAPPASETAAMDVRAEQVAPMPVRSAALPTVEGEVADAVIPENDIAETRAEEPGQGDVLENELLALLGGLGEKVNAKSHPDAGMAPAEREAHAFEQSLADPQDAEQHIAAGEDPADVGTPSPAETAGLPAEAEAGETDETFDLDDAAILDEFEDALNDDLAFSMDEFGEADDAPENDANTAVAGSLSSADGQPELFSDGSGLRNETAPVLETAEMPAGDIEAMVPLDLPDLPALEEKRSEATDIERELDAALAGFDQYDHAGAEEEPPAPPKSPPEHTGSGEADFDFTAFEDGLARDLEFVNHDMEADNAAGYSADSDASDSGQSGTDVQKPRRGLTIAAVVGGVAILGAIGAFGLVSGGGETDSAPVLVKADPDPVKIVPEDPGGKQVPNQDRAVYNEVDGQAASVPTQQTLVSTSEEPIDLRANDAASLPAGMSESGKAEDRLMPGDSSDAGGQGTGDAPVLAPKRVKTVVVKPDGSFVAAPPASATQTAEGTSAAPVQVTGLASTATGISQSENAGAQDVRQIELASTPDSDGTDAADGGAAIANEDAASTAIGQVDAEENVAAVSGDQPAAETVLASSAENGTVGLEGSAQGVLEGSGAATEPGGEQIAITQPINPPRIIPDRPSDNPIDTIRPQDTQVAAAPPQAGHSTENATQPPAVPTSEYTVQIASLPTEELAQSTASRLSQRYPELLGDRSISIVRADIEGRGTFHRVRVSAAGRDDAISLCERYKQAGGSCFVAR